MAEKVLPGSKGVREERVGLGSRGEMIQCTHMRINE
jgi:hypothetical protein